MQQARKVLNRSIAAVFCLFLMRSLCACQVSNAANSSGPSDCAAAGGRCILGPGRGCAVVGPQDCNPDRNPGGAICCLAGAKVADPDFDGGANIDSAFNNRDADADKAFTDRDLPSDDDAPDVLGDSGDGPNGSSGCACSSDTAMPDVRQMNLDCYCGDGCPKSLEAAKTMLEGYCLSLWNWMPGLYPKATLSFGECGLVAATLNALDSGQPSWVFDVQSGELVGAKREVGGFATPPSVCANVPNGVPYEARAGVQLDASCPVVTTIDLCARDAGDSDAQPD